MPRFRSDSQGQLSQERKRNQLLVDQHHTKTQEIHQSIEKVREQGEEALQKMKSDKNERDLKKDVYGS